MSTVPALGALGGRTLLVVSRQVGRGEQGRLGRAGRAGSWGEIRVRGDVEGNQRGRAERPIARAGASATACITEGASGAPRLQGSSVLREGLLAPGLRAELGVGLATRPSAQVVPPLYL